MNPRQDLSPVELVRLSEVLGALSFALDLTDGQHIGHALRACLIGMELADRLDLPLAERRDLYYALMLKDVGCSGNSARVFELFGGDERAAKQDLRRTDWSSYFAAARTAMAHAAPGAPWFERARRIASLAGGRMRVANELVELRCARAGEIVRQLGFGRGVADAVGSVEERWDGRGLPRGLSGQEIPILARVIGLAQAVEVFAMLEGAETSIELARDRSGRWFDPVLVAACDGLGSRISEWCGLDAAGLRVRIREREPGDAALLAGPGTLDRIAIGFAQVVDAKSPFTAEHSSRVTELSLRIAERLGFRHAQLAELRRAALLHDLGKLSVPNSILDKPGPLTPEEWETVKLHPYYTEMILDHIRGFGELSFLAASHHERLDGNGYWRGLRGEQIPLGSQVLATADMFDALSASRPYRPALPIEVALRLIEKDRGTGLEAECFDALVEVLDEEAPGDRETDAA